MVKYVLMRIGGGPKLVGPFDDFESAARYLLSHKLVSYIITPLDEPQVEPNRPIPQLPQQVQRKQRTTSRLRAVQLANAPVWENFNKTATDAQFSAAHHEQMEWTVRVKLGDVEDRIPVGIVHPTPNEWVEAFLGALLEEFPLVSFQKITAIKLVREWSARVFGVSWGLREAKDAVDTFWNKHGLKV